MNYFTYWSVMVTYGFATKNMLWQACKLGQLTTEEYKILSGLEFDLNNPPQN